MIYRIVGLIIILAISGCAYLKNVPAPDAHMVPDGAGGYYIYKANR